MLDQSAWVFKPQPVSFTEHGPLGVENALGQGALQLRQRTGIWKLSPDTCMAHPFLKGDLESACCAHHTPLLLLISEKAS